MKFLVKDVLDREVVALNGTLILPGIAREVAQVANLQPVQLQGKAEWQTGDVVVQGDIETTVRYICSRCLNEFDQLLRTDLEQHWTVHASRANEDVRLVGEGQMVDLAPYVEEAVFLALDVHPLCQADCKGLCPTCGCNWNEATCDCDNRKIDPRLEALKDLLWEGDSE